uniref:Uncharacterized protein n=1 Tax=Piliocolobus tephrosceles TaxID=591936 RepID=A0A8C9IBX7_9PRIM
MIPEVRGLPLSQHPTPGAPREGIDLHRGCTWWQEQGRDAFSARGPTSHSRSLGCSSAPAPAGSRVRVTGGSAGHLFRGMHLVPGPGQAEPRAHRPLLMAQDLLNSWGTCVRTRTLSPSEPAS